MAEKKKVMDVAKPEDATPPIGAKPMIVGHKSLPIDPMVKAENEKSEEETISESPISEKLSAPSEKQKTITPPSEKPQIEAKPEVKAPDEEQATTKPSQEKEKQTTSTESPKEEPNGESESKDVSDGEKQIDPVVAEMEKQAEVRKMIDSKKYFVSVKQAKRTHPAKAVLMLIAILLAGIGTLFYLVDTDRLDIGFELPFSIFKNEVTTESQVSKAENTIKSVESVDDSTKKAIDQSAENRFEIPDFDFSIEKDPALVYANKSSYFEGEPQTLGFSIEGDGYTLLGRTVTGKGGMCEPSSTDTPHAPNNTCPTREVQQVIDASHGWVSLVKLTNPKSADIVASTTYDYCYTPNKDSTGKPVQRPVESKPEMGFVLQCNPEDIFITISQSGDAEENNTIASDVEDVSFYNNENIRKLINNLATIKLHQNR